MDLEDKIIFLGGERVDNNIILYEIKNNKLENGEGKNFFDNGKIEFEGEFKNGEKWDGKGYDIKGNLIYQLINGNGNIKTYDDGKLQFEGRILNGEKNRDAFYNDKTLDGQSAKGKLRIMFAINQYNEGKSSELEKETY